MMKRKQIHIYLLFFSLMLCIEPLSSQKKQKNIEFDLDTHNYGVIKGENQRLKHQFKFTNTTDVPVYIKRISASCGCTVPSWTRDTIYPNERGSVDITLRVGMLSGYFSRGVDIYTNLSETPIPLLVTGRVLRNHRYNDPFQNNAGHLLSDDTIFNFGKIKIGTEAVKDIKFINNGLDTVLFLIKKQPQRLNVEQTKTIVVPGGNSMITLTINSKMKKRRIEKMREIEIVSIRPKKDTIVFSIPIKTEFIK